MTEENTNRPGTDNKEQNGPVVPNQLPELSEMDMLSARVVEFETTAAHYKDQLLRKAAEFENYRKRIENDSANLVRFANEELIEKFLPVLDDFDRSFAALKNMNSGGESFIKGIELIYNKLRRIFELQGIKPIDVVGQPFDPELHDALLQMPSKEHPPNTVIQEVEKGYTLHDRVIRHSKVIVSAEPESGETTAQNDLSESD